ncbi:MAG: class E sortase, partial [Actinobacteria bacterium]|nr:class E sortase [Actinomycetota bacterium]
EGRWENPRTARDRPLEGDGIARLFVPGFGSDYSFTVLEGTSAEILAAGPGHYTDTALPGQPGNFAVAGHRVGKGAPFNDLDLLESCDALVVETRTEWFVYRVLPLQGEAPGWAEGEGAQERCRGVAPLPPPYPEVPGKEIVPPSDGSVIAPVPGQPRDAALPPDAEARLITLTTCHPKFSARERLIVHGVLVAQYPKGGERPAELMEG